MVTVQWFARARLRVGVLALRPGDRKVTATDPASAALGARTEATSQRLRGAARPASRRRRQAPKERGEQAPAKKARPRRLPDPQKPRQQGPGQEGASQEARPARPQPAKKAPASRPAKKAAAKATPRSRPASRPESSEHRTARACASCRTRPPQAPGARSQRRPPPVRTGCASEPPCRPGRTCCSGRRQGPTAEAQVHPHRPAARRAGAGRRWWLRQPVRPGRVRPHDLPADRARQRDRRPDRRPHRSAG